GQGRGGSLGRFCSARNRSSSAPSSSAEGSGPASASRSVPCRPRTNASYCSSSPRTSAPASAFWAICSSTSARTSSAAERRVPVGTGEQQERRAGVVVQQVQFERRLLVLLPVVLQEDHGWPAGPVVDELVGVEGGHQARLQRAEQVLAGEVGGVARVDEAGQRLYQYRPARLGQLAGQLVQFPRIEHRLSLPGAVAHPIRPNGRSVRF